MEIIKQRLSFNYIYPIVLFFFALLVCLTAGTAPFNITRVDSSVFIYIAKLMQNGQVPYLDSFDHKGLLQYIINYIGLFVGGKTGIWIYEIISMYISLIYSYKTVIILTKNRMVSFFSTLCSFALLGDYFQGGNFTEEYALPFIVISLYIFTKFLFTKKSSLKTANLVILGFSFGAVLMLRQNMISVWVVYTAAIIIRLLTEKRYKFLIKYSLMFLMGLFIVVIPSLIYLIANSALSAFVAQYFEFNFIYSSSAEIKSILSAIIKFSSTGVFIISILVYALLIMNIRRHNLYIIISGVAYLLLTILLMTISGRSFEHYGMILIPCFIIPLGYLFDYIQTNYFIKYSTSRQLISLFVIVSTITSLQSIKFARNYILSIIRMEQMKYYVNDELVQFIESNTNENDPIIVFGNKAAIYLASNRYSASKYFYQYPIGIIDERIATDFIEDIKFNPPKLIVDYKNNINNTDRMAVFLKKYTDINYEMYSIDGDTVFLRKSLQ